jgi:hypothetical protein
LGRALNLTDRRGNPRAATWSEWMKESKLGFNEEGVYEKIARYRT